MEKRMQSLSLSVIFVPMTRITIDPAVMSGKPCIRGLRVTVANVLRQLANHRTPAEILASYPYLEAEDIDACLAYAALRVEDEELAVGAA
jgi:uncharacterized protein (DUF433 family)